MDTVDFLVHPENSSADFHTENVVPEQQTVR